ncbi:RagB/SusD family nutrient uptake outer membrane protein [Compostibacter hankyongensis]|uniref:RagB/SusD family nutrient uptake outer membrane protein n=1 Tax=Compostibacter hankyongensis TaxID=1007089 RepID=A0ABP8FT66_9BACT
MSSCTKFLEVKPIDKFSGEEFWRNREDAEKAVNSCYELLKEKFLESALYNTPDFRPGVWDYFKKTDFETLSKNALNSPDMSGDGLISILNSWQGFYKCIASSNLCIDRIPDIQDESLGEKEKRQLTAEARFIRSFTYFYMVEMYGDVPLQTDPYSIENKPRAPMQEVLDFCLKDLETAAPDLPQVYDDPTNRAVRATQGAAYTLMAHIYMWKAGFAKSGQEEYWQKAADLCKQVMDLGVYKLLPYSSQEDMQAIFKGRSEEGIFELSLDANYGNSYHFIIAQYVLHQPVIQSNANLYGGLGSEIVLKREVIDKLYPPGEQDNRLSLWFDDPYCTVNPQSAMFLKFSSISEGRDFDANLIFFRYAGLILLRAEALAGLGKDEEAIEMLNKVRTRAGVSSYTGGGSDALKDAVFLEREKELLGEGHLWYDLVRTRRVLDLNQTYNYLTPDMFDQAAWTWPVPQSAIDKDPLITQNLFWAK